jgi:hypothetical protein
MELSWVTMDVAEATGKKGRGAPLKPAHSDPLKQAKREKERLAKQGVRERAAQRAAAAKEAGVALLAPRRGPTPLPDDRVSDGHRKKRARLAIKTAVAAVTDAGLPDFAIVAAAIESMAEQAAAENAAAMQAAAEQVAVEQATAAATLAVFAQAAPEQAERVEAERAEVEQAAAEQAAAEKAAAEAAAAKAAAKQARLRAREAWLHASTGNDGPQGYRTELAVARPKCDECAICFAHVSRTMACCGGGVCRDCLSTWLSMSGYWEAGYGENAATLGLREKVVPHPKGVGSAPVVVRDGRPALVKVNTKTCPVCRTSTESTQRAGLGR